MYIHKLAALFILIVSAIGIGEHAYAAACVPPSAPGVTVEIQSSLQQTVASASVGYSATIHNAGSIAYNDAVLAIEVRDASSSRVVDRYIVPDISVEANSATEAPFVWRTSVGLVPSMYIVRATFVPSRTNYGDVYAGSSLPFGESSLKVVAGAKLSAQFAGAIAINPSQQNSETIAVHIPISNAGSLPFRGSVVWRVWPAGGAQIGQPLSEERTEVEMLPQGSAIARYEIPKNKKASFYIEAELVNNNAPLGYTGTWIVNKTVTQANTLCGFEMSLTTLAEIGGLIVALILFVLAGVSLRNMHRTKSSGSLN